MDNYFHLKTIFLLASMFFGTTFAQNDTTFDRGDWNFPTSTGRKVIIPPLITLEPTTFSTQFNEKTIAFRVGESFELPCAASGQPTPTYSWVWNERPFDPSGMDGRIAIQPGVGTLIFANPEPLDEAIYQCQAKNQAGIAVTIKINVRQAVLDKFPELQPVKLTPRLGSKLILKCIPPRSYPKPQVYWSIMKPNDFVSLEMNDRVSIDPIGNLIIANVIESDYKDGSIYYCTAYNNVMRTFVRGYAYKIEPIKGLIPITNAPEIAWQSPTQQFALRGNTLTMKCIFYGNPTPRVNWYRVGPPGKLMPVKSSRTSFGQELNINDITYDDEGSYECEGINDGGLTPVRRSFTVTVQSTPYWVEKPVSQDVSEGEMATFRCSGESIPEPDVIWYFNGVPTTNLTKKVDQKYIVRRNEVVFMNVTIKDALVIQCNISNKHGYNFTNAYLNVLSEPPIIVEKPLLDQKTAEGMSVVLRCNVKGAPKPQVVWTKAGEELTGGRFKVLPNGNLSITDVSLVDAGAYTCRATNKLGVDEATGFLIVRRRTRIVMAPQGMMVYYKTEAKFSCTATTDSEEIDNLEINWKKDNSLIDYSKSMRMFRNAIDNSLTISSTIYLDTGRYTCSARNGIDTAEASANLIVQAPPEPPTDVQVRCYTQNNQAEIWWSPGKENFAPILNFIVQYNTSFQQDLWYDIATNLSQNQRRIVVSMSPWGNYSFRVLARNKIGTSLPSLQSYNICTTQPGYPSHNPENVIGEGDEPGNLVIFWTPMPKIEQNGPDFKYIISWILADVPGAKMNSEIVGTTNAWHYIVKDRYEPYQKFRVSVKANNAKGDGLGVLNWYIGYSGEDIPRVTPTDVRVVEETLTSTSVNLTWTNVDLSPSSIVGFFRGYRVEYASEADYPYNVRFQDFIIQEAVFYPRKRIMKRQAPPPVVNNRTVSFQLTRLPPNTNVIAVVRVLNKYYAGPASSRIQFTTPEGLPGPPETLSVAVRGATHFVIQWSPPRETNGNLVGYNITYQAISGMNMGRLQYYDSYIPPDKTEARATGLNPNTTYRIYVAASTLAGKGEPIFVDSVTSESGDPNPPTFTIFEMNDTFANISWTPSRSGIPGSVFYVQYKPRTHYDWLRSPDEYMANHMALMSLDPGTTYQVRVVAKNGDGFEAPAVWQEFHTPGVAPGYFDLKTSGWFYGIWISLFLILVLIICLFYLKKYTDKQWEEKENEIEEEMRRLQAEEAARQMGLFNAETGDNPDGFLEDEQKYPLKDDSEFYQSRPMQYNDFDAGPSNVGYRQPASQQQQEPQYSDFMGGYKVKPASDHDTFV